MGIYMCIGQGGEILEPENVVNAIDNPRLQSVITELEFQHCVAGIFCSWGTKSEGEELERFKNYLRVVCKNWLIPFVIKEGKNCGLLAT